MSSVTPTIPFKAWLKLHAKAICQALPLSLLIVVEARDLYYRATWDVTPVPPSKFEVGDVIAVCNRWYTLPTWSHVVYSWLSKVLLKSCWDDVGVISSVRNGTPHILYVDFHGVHEQPLDAFLEARCPRGAAVRKLHRDEGVPSPSPAIADLFRKEVEMISVEPWFLFSASMRGGNEHKYYEFCVRMHEQRCKIRSMLQRRQSRRAIEAQQTSLQEMEVMRQHLAKFVEPVTHFHLYNGSLVASLFATYGLLDRDMPSPSRYVPQDFAHTIPFLGATTLDEPIVFFRN
ncbi:hypothetical protein conserved [Leishmania donovani]|uniref:Hypothetical_protein_conserved n=1 Tax=Leishmania donovani TaxID=5661 RepID=A0A3Q8IVK6_LEIDO|nr:hypothetical protein, conserved [Leishmania donovani]AYU83268.1 hypothetical protein LdCL_350051900 [Leishmania donovani]TPP44718.1 hypothetical protein CGC21_7755 [Leishmania donovani]TPP47875.1 hypothetical protein CGC20_14445 [Leishmania donovani]CAJ1993279.1 hypothetical protein conserved [Leishmania donovani]CBZ38366.1 hypothetical protein, conserved [Leishmania donovani]